MQLMRISVVHLLIRGAILPPARGVLRPLARKASRGGARRVPRPQGTVEEQWGVAGWNASSCDAFRRVLEHGERGRLGKAPGLCEAAREAPDCGTERLLRDGKCASVRELIGPAPPSSCSDDAACSEARSSAERAASSRVDASWARHSDSARCSAVSAPSPATDFSWL